MSLLKIKQSILLIITLLGSQIGQSQTATFSYTGASQTYEVAPGVTRIRIEVSGGQGGNGTGGVGGLGATMIGDFEVEGGDMFTVIVGGAGEEYSNSGGGGGGSGVLDGAVPLIIAGGGGGAAQNADGMGGVITEDGGSSSGAGGTAGSGGEKGYWSGDCGWAGGGGGFLTDGYGGTVDWDGGPLPGVLGGEGAGKSWDNGGEGGVDGGCTFSPNAGAWGCGGGGAGEYGGAGGGGYSGGGGGQYVDEDLASHGGGGGGSFNEGTDQVNTAANHAGAGEVIITVICGPETVMLSTTIGDELYGTDGSIDLEISGDNPPYTIDWDTDEADDFDDEEDLTDLVGGTYTVVVRDSLGCLYSESFTVNSQVSVLELSKEGFRVYPNPAQENLTIEIEGSFEAVLYNVNGEFLTQIYGNNVGYLSLDAYAKGTYFVQIKHDNTTKTIQIVKD